MNLSACCRRISIITLLSLSYTATANIDLPSRLIRQQLNKARAESNDTEIPIILRLKDNTDISVLENAGIKPSVFRNNLAIISLASSRVNELNEIKEVISVSFGRLRVHPTMDKARMSAGIDNIHTGADVVSGKSYLGRGVIVGLMDQGLDPNHLNFKDDNYVSRFSKIWTLMDANGEYTEYSDNDIAAFTTEMPESFHGTYTCGILAGNYSGKGQMAYLGQNGECIVSEGNIPYYGVAPEAEIVAGCGILSDANIITAVENIINYAESQGKTPVINLSIGSAGGSFDLADPLCAYLNDVGRNDAIIVAAAGNDGHKRISASRRFISETDKPLLTFFDGLESISIPTPSNFYIEIWGDDQEFQDIDIILYDRQSGESTVLYTFPDEYVESAALSTYIDTNQCMFSDKLARYFAGTLTVGREINAINNRSHTMILTGLRQLQPDNQAVIGVRIRGKAGHGMHMTTDGTLQLSAFDIEGAENGNPDLSISSLVCGENIISVGAHVTRTSNGCLNGSTHTIFNYFYPSEEGYAAYFSSYAILPDGRTYPTITAPGNEVISSYSRYYTSSLTEESLGNYAAYATDANGKRHYWQTECGTSSATPFVAGTIATWLEADPSLSPNEAKEILCKTAIKDRFSQNADIPARYGYGKTSSLEGLNEVLSRKTETEGILAENNNILIYGNNKIYTVSVFGARKITAELYDISGRLLTHAISHSESLQTDYNNFSQGIYIMSVSATTDTQDIVRHTYKVVLK